MPSRFRFSTLVLAAALAWAALAGIFAMSPEDATSQVKTFAGTFPTSAVVFATQPGR